MDRERARQEIRERISCLDYLQKSKNGLYCCPYCGSGTGPKKSGAVKYYQETNTFYCHACNHTGDVIDLYQKTTGKDYNTALFDLAAIAGITIDTAHTDARRIPFNGSRSINTPPAEKSQERADYTEYYAACKNNLYQDGNAGKEYLQKRGVLSAAIFYGVGFDPEADPASAPGGKGEKKHPCPRIIIPCSKGHYVARSIDPNTKEIYKKMNPAICMGADSPAIFNADALTAQEVQEVFITEGAFDALSVLEMNGQAIALNSTNNADKLIEMIEQHQTAATLILCLDNDKAGSNAAQKVQEGLKRLEQPYIVADICNGAKDPNDALQADRDLFYDAVHNAIAEARAYRRQLQQEAQREQQERQQRTGASMVDSFLEAVKSRKYEPIPTGITDIDRAIGGGFIRQQLVLLGAAPGAGKTALAQWIFEGMAKRGVTSLYINLEMSREQMLARSISRIAKQNGDTIRVTDILQGYKWTIEQEEAISIAAEQYRAEIAPRMIYNPDEVTSDLDSILNYAEAEAQLAEKAGLPAPLVIVDYLHIITGKDREDDAAILKRAVSSFKNYAIRHNTIVFLIQANNRPANKSGDVTQESGRDTSALEYSADLQLGLAFTRCLDRPGEEKLSKEQLTPEDMQFITLKITKSRFSKLANVDLFFDGETMTYTQIDNKRTEENERTNLLNLRRH